MVVNDENSTDNSIADWDEPAELGSGFEDFFPSPEQSVPKTPETDISPREERVDSLEEEAFEQSSRTFLETNPTLIGLVPKIEAILYLRGQSLSIADLMESTQSDREAVEDALIALMSDYAHRDSALEVVETATGYCLQLRKAFQSLIDELVPAELGTGALRTLAAIALKSPILQSELIELRGSSAYQQVHELVEQGFVRKRRQSEGRSYWLEVTDKFHQYFEIEQLSQVIQESAPQ
jgi:segregation and condensation protein B